jgi:hypothetical protein
MDEKETRLDKALRENRKNPRIVVISARVTAEAFYRMK